MYASPPELCTIGVRAPGAFASIPPEASEIQGKKRFSHPSDYPLQKKQKAQARIPQYRDPQRPYQGSCPFQSSPLSVIDPEFTMLQLGLLLASIRNGLTLVASCFGVRKRVPRGNVLELSGYRGAAGCSPQHRRRGVNLQARCGRYSCTVWTLV